MQKTIHISDQVTNDDGQVFAKIDVTLNGDGSTPNVRTFSRGVVGFNDDGSPIKPEQDDQKLNKAQQAVMAEAIKSQKALTKENGGDPSKVNVIGAETKATPTARQTLDAGMMKDIALLKIKVAQLQKKEGSTNANQ